MRKTAWLGAVLIAIGIFGLISVSGQKDGFWNDWFSFGADNIHIEKRLDAADVRNVFIQTGSANIEVVAGNSDQIVVRLDGRVSSRMADRIDIKVKPGRDKLELGIERPDHSGLGWFQFRASLTVELPKKEWDSIEVKVGSGNAKVEDIAGMDIRVGAGSGNIRLTEAKADKIDVHTGSGNITAEEFEAEQLQFQTGSGNVKLTDGWANLKGQTGSGNIKVELDELTHDAELRAGSGNVTVNLNNAPESLAIDYHANSGNGRIKWDGVKYDEKSERGNLLRGKIGNGETKLAVRTGSGNFTLGQR